MALGLLLVGLFEIPRLFRIQNIEDAKYYTGLPVLASVPPLLSLPEKVWIKRASRLKLAAGAVFAIGIIPVIVLVLQATRVFEIITS